MKLSQLTSEPKLIEVTIDDEEIIKEYGESLTFYTWDRQPMTVFTKLANLENSNNKELLMIVKSLILDEDGKEVIDEKNMLPTKVLMKAIGKVTELLGK